MDTSLVMTADDPDLVWMLLSGWDVVHYAYEGRILYVRIQRAEDGRRNTDQDNRSGSNTIN